MRNTIGKTIGISLACLLLTGCWDRTELNELAITSAVALDKSDKEWILSCQVIIPSAISNATGSSGGSSSQAPVVVYSSSGSTMKDALSKSYLETPRKIYFAHTSVLIISEKAARKGLSQMIDLYLRNPDSRETVSLLISSGDSRSILDQLINMETIPGQGIQRILEKEHKNMSVLPNVRMYELSMDMLSPSHCGLVPEILISGTKEVTAVNQLQQTTMPSKIKLGRAAVIKDDKMIGWLGQKEELGAAFLRNKIASTIISFSCKEDGEDSGELMDSSFLLTNSHTKIKAQLEEGVYNITATIDAKGRLNETDCEVDLVKPDTIQRMEASIAQEIEKAAYSAWDSIQKLDADVLGFSGYVMKKYPKEWKLMQEEKISVLKKMKLTVKVHVNLDRVGLSTKSYKKLKED